MNLRNELQNLISNIDQKDLQKIYEYALSSIKTCTSEEEESVTILCCPHCGSVSIKRNGTYDRKQRFICKDCKKSFSTTTNTFFFHNRISKEVWKNFIDYEMDSLTLKSIAYYLDISVHTAFRMRHKLYRAVSSIVEKQTVSGEIQLDATYRKINLKGTKPDKMPRYSKKRGNGSAYSGISHHKICIISAIDTNDNMFLKISGLGPESYGKYTSCNYRFENPEIIISDSKPCIQQFANSLGVLNDKIPTKPNKKRYKTDNGNHLGDINELDSEISSLITKTHGVSTRYLQDYLNFITYRKQAKYKHERKEVVSYIYQEISNTQAFIEEELVFTELPISLKDAYYEYRYGIFA